MASDANWLTNLGDILFKKGDIYLIGYIFGISSIWQYFNMFKTFTDLADNVLNTISLWYYRDTIQAYSVYMLTLQICICQSVDDTLHLWLIYLSVNLLR